MQSAKLAKEVIFREARNRYTIKLSGRENDTAAKTITMLANVIKFLGIYTVTIITDMNMYYNG
jgi:hypothetical protein